MIWLPIAVFVVALCGLLLVVRRLQVKLNWHPELARKVVHMAMGLSCLSLPMLFDKTWPVWLLLTLSIVLLLATRLSPTCRQVMGNALHSVERRSFGELWFAFAVAIVFTLASQHQQPILFYIPLLILTFSDTAAALIGIRYGKFQFITSQGKKSIEGSAAFAITCFFLVAFPMALLTDIDAINVLLVALILALLIMMVEGACWEGIDNLFIPVGSFFLLRIYLISPVTLLVAHLFILITLIIFCIWARKKTLLDGSGLLGVILTCFYFWGLGGLLWLVAPTLYFFFYTYFSYRRGQTQRYIHDIKSVLAISGVASLCLIGEQIISSPLWLLASVSAFSGQLAIAGLARRSHYAPHHSSTFNTLIGMAQGMIYINLPVAATFYLADMPYIIAWLYASSAGLITACGLFYVWQPNINNLPRNNQRWIRQSLAGAGATLVTIIGTIGIPLYVN